MKFALASSLLIAAVSADCAEELTTCASKPVAEPESTDAACAALGAAMPQIDCLLSQSVIDECTDNAAYTTAIDGLKTAFGALKTTCDSLASTCKDDCDMVTKYVGYLESGKALDNGSSALQVTLGATLVGMGVAALN